MAKSYIYLSVAIWKHAFHQNLHNTYIFHLVTYSIHTHEHFNIRAHNTPIYLDIIVKFFVAFLACYIISNEIDEFGTFFVEFICCVLSTAAIVFFGWNCDFFSSFTMAARDVCQTLLGNKNFVKKKNTITLTFIRWGGIIGSLWKCRFLIKLLGSHK